MTKRINIYINLYPFNQTPVVLTVTVLMCCTATLSALKGSLQNKSMIIIIKLRE